MRDARSFVRPRRQTRAIRVGSVQVGGDAPITVQSMTTTKTHDVDGTLAQVYALAGAGADLVRITCNTVEAAQGLVEIRRLLKPGGRAGILDFNRLDPTAVAGRFQRFYLRRLVVPAAAAVGLEQHYSYLEASLKIFPDGPSQESLALKAGFQQAVHRPLMAQQMGALLLKA